METEKSVEAAPLFEVEATAKSVPRTDELAAWTERVAKGEDEPTPKIPPTIPLLDTKRLVVDAVVAVIAVVDAKGKVFAAVAVEVMAPE